MSIRQRKRQRLQTDTKHVLRNVNFIVNVIKDHSRKPQRKRYAFDIVINFWFFALIKDNQIAIMLIVGNIMNTDVPDTNLPESLYRDHVTW